MALGHEKPDAYRLAICYFARVFERSGKLNGVHHHALDQWLLCYVCMMVGVAQLFAADPVTVVPFSEEGRAGHSITAREQAVRSLMAAETAFANGFSESALRLYRVAFAGESPLLWQENPAAAYNYALALLLEQRGAEARQFIDSMPQTDSVRWRLRRLLLEVQSMNEPAVAVLRSGLDIAALPAPERRWLHLADAWLASRRGQLLAVNEAFALMIASSTGPAEVAFAELLRDYELLRSGRPDEATVASLRATERSMQGRRGGFEAARLLAIALHQLGRRQDALDVIERQLRLPAVQELDMRAQFLFLMGLVAGEDSLRGRLALQQILRERHSDLYQRNALFLLARAADRGVGAQEFQAFLDELISRPQNHPLLDLLLHSRAFLALQFGQMEQAELFWLQLLEQFPGSVLSTAATRGLALSNWQRTPPRYRVSADYWNRLRQQLPPGRERDWTIVLMADAFFLNSDYVNAVDLYNTVRPRFSGAVRAALGYQQVIALIRGERMEDAARLLDALRVDGSLDDDLQWRAEWNWMDAQRRRGTVSSAVERLNSLRLVADEQLVRLSPALQIRLAWLDTRLALDAGHADQVPGLVDDLLTLVQTFESQLARTDVEEVRSNALLMKGEAFLLIAQSDSAAVVFRELRELYPESNAAILSYLIEARDLSAQDSLVSAQQSLIRLADLFPRTRFAPLALWEAAVNARQRELASTYQEAITILERLINEYPDHYLAYFARLKQGDLSRLLNDFGTALLLYENLLNQYPNHPERFRALMGVADALLARGSQNPLHFQDAAAHYERVFAMTNVPVEARFEVGYKSMVALNHAGRARDAEVAFWNLMALADSEGFFRFSDLPADRARYWLARAIFHQAEWLETNQQAESAADLYLRIYQHRLPGWHIAKTRLPAAEETL